MAIIWRQPGEHSSNVGSRSVTFFEMLRVLNCNPPFRGAVAVPSCDVVRGCPSRSFGFCELTASGVARVATVLCIVGGVSFLSLTHVCHQSRWFSLFSMLFLFLTIFCPLCIFMCTHASRLCALMHCSCLLLLP